MKARYSFLKVLNQVRASLIGFCATEPWPSPIRIPTHTHRLSPQNRREFSRHFPVRVTLLTPAFLRTFPHWRQNCLFSQICCLKLRFTSADGLSRLENFRSKRTNFQRSRGQILSPVKTGRDTVTWTCILMCHGRSQYIHKNVFESTPQQFFGRRIEFETETG